MKVEELSNKDVNNKRTKRSKDTIKLKEIGCDETLSLMHGLGRIFNPKYDEKTNRLSHSPETLTDTFLTQPNNLLQFMFSNYLTHFSTVSDAANCCGEFSLSDFLISEYREASLAELSLNVAVRGAMVANSQPKSGWIPVKGYKRDQTNEMELQEEYLRFIGTEGREVRNLESKSRFVMDFRGTGLLKKGGEGDEKEGYYDLDKEELELIQQIEMEESD